MVSTVSLAYSQVIYVKKGGHGDGTSWENALGDLQQALQFAKPGQQIWVAQGTYTPTTGIDRNATFSLPEAVSVYGGFKGYETHLHQRDWNHNPTILSGEIGSTSVEDNSFTVIYTKNVSSLTRLDGFTITMGMANAKGSGINAQRCGGGWFNDGSNGISSPTIENCLFIKNYARDGGALFNFSQNGITQPLIQRCQFVVNKSGLDGGAITNDGSYGQSRPQILDSEFLGNEAVYGACLLNRAESGQAIPVIKNCLFAGNISYVSGSGIYNAQKNNGISTSILSACRFEGNQASVSGDVSGSPAPNTSSYHPELEQGRGIVIRSSKY